jgi:DtxR family Mn-dependent transcriptional regulator
MATLSRSRQDYLKALYALEPDGMPVTTSRLAARLEVSPPSVTNMLARLARAGLVRHRPREGASLSESGRLAALATVRRHRILETFLVRVLGLDWAEVHDDAEVLEHAISERVLDAMDRLTGHPLEDPHGHPIPDARGRMRGRRLVSLGRLGRGAVAVVREIREARAARMERWKKNGLVPGARVCVRDVDELEGMVLLEVAGHRVRAGRTGLEGVRVEPARGPLPAPASRRAARSTPRTTARNGTRAARSTPRTSARNGTRAARRATPHRAARRAR